MIAMQPLSDAQVQKYRLPAGQWVGAEVSTGRRGLRQTMLRSTDGMLAGAWHLVAAHPLFALLIIQVPAWTTATSTAACIYSTVISQRAPLVPSHAGARLGHRRHARLCVHR